VSNNTRQLSPFLSLSLSRVINICFVKQHSKCGHRYATTLKHTHTYVSCVCNLQTASNSEFHAYRARALFPIFVHDERGIYFYQMAILSSKEWTLLSHTTHSLTSSTTDKIRVSMTFLHDVGDFLKLHVLIRSKLSGIRQYIVVTNGKVSL